MSHIPREVLATLGNKTFNQPSACRHYCGRVPSLDQCTGSIERACLYPPRVQRRKNLEDSQTG